MSASATFWAWNQVVKSSQKLVLLALANCHNDSTGQCNPSIKYISDQTGLNRKTVLSSLSALEEMGLIIPRKSSGSSNSYNLNTSPEIGTGSVDKYSTKNGTASVEITSTKTGTSTENGPVPNSDKTSTKNGTNQYQNRDTNLKETKKNLKDIYRKLSLSDVPFELHSAVKEFIDHRVNLKKPLTQDALKRFLSAVSSTSTELSMSPESVIAETIDAGWQSVKPEWMRNRLGGRNGTHLNNQPEIIEQTYGASATDF